MQRIKLFISIFIIAICCGCNNTTVQATHTEEVPSVATLKLSSPVFKNGDTIPMLYTCDSTNISPPLNWNKPFSNIVSYALIMDDPDVPTQPWVHWVVYNIPASDTSLPMHVPVDSLLPNGTKQGFTSFPTPGYGGPCPPSGVHRYYFKLYALDAKLNVRAGLTKSQLLNIMNGHILAEADLMGKYSKKKNAQ